MSMLAVEHTKEYNLPKSHKKTEKNFLVNRSPFYKVGLLQNSNLGILFINYLKHESQTDLTFKIEETLNQVREFGISIPEPDSIRKYLISYPEIADIINYACQTSREYFGEHTFFSLEMYRHIEFQDEYPTLYIRQEKYDENILDTIEEIREKYDEKMIGKSGWFFVSTDFKDPKRIDYGF